MRTEPLFGPAGNCEAFRAAGYKHTWQMFGFLASHGLTAYEYQCGRGVRVSAEAAAVIRQKAQENGITVSLHAPYYISLASAETEKRDNSIRYILDSARAVSWMGGDRIVVHPGGLGGRTREEATAVAIDTLVRARHTLDEAGLEQVYLCPEVMGKINQLGNLGEVLSFCQAVPRCIPCVDFGHLNSRTAGSLLADDAYAAVWDTVTQAVGETVTGSMHVHFSKIEYTAGGEKQHLTFTDTVYGPEPAPLMRFLAQNKLTPTVICESAGTQTLDAVEMRRLYEEYFA